MSHVTLDRMNTRIAAGASSAAASPGPSDFARLHRGRRMPIQLHADLASRIYSGLALGLFAYLAMLPDGQAFSIREMQRTHKEGRDAWSGALAELLELGLVCRIRWSDGRGQWRTRYYLAEDHPFDADDIAFLRETHGQGCLVECSPELSNCPIQVSSRVSRRPRKTSSEAPRSGARPVTVRESCPTGRVVDNSASDRRKRVSGLVEPGDAIAATGRPAHAIAATGPTRENAEQGDGEDLAAIAGTHKEGKYLSFPPPYPPRRARTSRRARRSRGREESTPPPTRPPGTRPASSRLPRFRPARSRRLGCRQLSAPVRTRTRPR